MLEMKNVTKTFGNFKALDDLTLTVPSGRVYRFMYLYTKGK